MKRANVTDRTASPWKNGKSSGSERRFRSRKRQQPLTLSGGNGKRKGTDTARLLFEVIEFPIDFGGLDRL